MLSLSKNLTDDIRRRIDRGEAHRSSIALSRGSWCTGPPSATIELSSHGIYNVQAGCEVFLAQRFDGYDGISIVVHSDKAGNDTLGPMRVLGSIGCKINHEYASELIQRAVFLVSAIACG